MIPASIISSREGIFLSLLSLLLLLSSSSSSFVLSQKVDLTNSNIDDDFNFIQSSLTLTTPFECHNQLHECFARRFSLCFAKDEWFQQKQDSIKVAVYRTALPWQVENITDAKYVTVIFQLLNTNNNNNQINNKPDHSATMSLIEDAGVGTQSERKCVWNGIGGSTTKSSRNQQQQHSQQVGFKLLRAWKEPLPPPGDLSENWFGIGMSILCAFIPCIFVSLNVYRRWRKYSKSVKNYRKIIKELRGDDVSSSSSDDSTDSDFEEMMTTSNTKKKQKRKLIMSDDDSLEKDGAVEMSETKQHSNNNEGEKVEGNNLAKDDGEMGSSTASNSGHSHRSSAPSAEADSNNDNVVNNSAVKKADESSTEKLGEKSSDKNKFADI